MRTVITTLDSWKLRWSGTFGATGDFAPLARRVVVVNQIGDPQKWEALIKYDDWTLVALFKPEAPSFTGHFTHPLYHDEVNDFAPFGSDEAADLFADYSREDGRSLGPSSTLRDILQDDYDLVVLSMDGKGDLSLMDSIVIAAGFTLLRLTGQIDEPGREVLMHSLERQRARYGDVKAPEYRQMLSDLEAFSTNA